MRAAVSTRYGPPDVVRVVDDAPDPDVAPDDLLVRVHATTVNRTDCAYRRAYPFFVRAMTGWRGPKVQVWGTEYAGVVERVGPQVTRFAPGDRVFGYAEGRFGTHAELVSVAESSFVATVPDGVDLRHAAAATEGGHYALSSIRRAGVQAGEPGARARCHRRDRLGGGALLVDQGVDVIATAPTAYVELVRAWAPVASSTSRPRTSPASTRASTSCSTSWARARSGPAGRSWPSTGSTCRATSGRSRRTSRCPWSPGSAAAAGSSSRSR